MSSSSASQLSPELSRGVLQLARALIVAARNWTLYPPEHPTVEAAVTRLRDAIRQATAGGALGVGVTPETLIVAGHPPAAGADLSVAEAAALLHDRDILALTFFGDVPPDGVARLLRLLGLEQADRRDRGGPAQIWAVDGHPSIHIEQIDYASLLSREEGDTPPAARRDDLWRSIVASIAGGQKTTFDERTQQRLLDIAGSAGDVAALATEVMSPLCAPDGSPMITSQAATVLAAFRHFTSIVSVMAPDRVPEVMNNLAAAAGQLDSHVVMQMMQTADQPGAVAVVGPLAAAFDDAQVAQLLATALALEGRASERLATIFNTIAPDPDRKRRVLTMARHLLSETDFGKSGQFQALWTSAEELLISYDDAPFVSEAYRASLDGVGARADRLAVGDLPSDLPVWLDTLGEASVRALSVLLLVDLLSLERDAARAADIALDMSALAEDLLMAGAYADARTVAAALAARARGGQTGSDPCRDALDRLGRSAALAETAAVLGELEGDTLASVEDIVATIGPAAVDALRTVLESEQESPASTRAAALAAGFGPAAVPHLAPLLHDSRWYVLRNGARLLGRIASPDGVPLLQPLLRSRDPRVAREVVSALSAIPDPSAARAIHTILRAATGEVRSAIIAALVADRDTRVVPMLGRILGESQPLGDDHQIVLDTLTALGMVGSDDAVPPLAAAMRVRSFWRRGRARAVKQRSVGALARIATPKAEAALADAARGGDRLLRRLIRNRGKA